MVPLKNESGQLITQLAQKLVRIVKKTNETPHISHPFPLWPTGVFLEGNEGNMEENRGADAKLGKPLEESQVFFFRAFPRGKIILEVLEMPGTPEKQKGAAATITKQIQKLAKKINQ